MTLKQYLTTEETSALINYFGQIKVDRVQDVLHRYISKWEITHIALIPYYSVNILFNVTLADGQEAIIKIYGQVDHYTTREIAMLSKGLPLYCQVLNYNADDGVMLLEKAKGQSLHMIVDLNKRLDVFIQVFNAIHSPITAEEIHNEQNRIFPSYLDLLVKIKKWTISNHIHDMINYIDEAISFYDELQLVYASKAILHGDLHHDNIVYSVHHLPVVIDPKGVIDSEIYDIPRYILNEFNKDVVSTDVSMIVNVINYLSHKLNYPFIHIAKSLCIESILSVIWTLQDSEEEVDINHYIAKHEYCRQFILI